MAAKALNYSAITAHRRCPQAWYYRSVLEIRQDSGSATPVERDLGSWWSGVRAAEAMERGRALGSLKLWPERLDPLHDGTGFDGATVTVDEVLEAAERWWPRQSIEYRERFQDVLGWDNTRAALEAMLERWRNRWSRDTKNEHPIAVEVQWNRVLPVPSGDDLWGGGDTGEVEMYGTADEVYLDTARNLVVVRDHKTTKSIQTATAADDMMDAQLHLYAWGLIPLLREFGVPQPGAVAYDRTRSVAPKSPAVTATGTLSKSVTDYDAETYRRWAEARPEWGTPDTFYKTGAKAGQPKFGTYQFDENVYEALSAPGEQAKWDSRTLTPVNLNIVRGHLRASVDTARSMRESERRAESVGEAARNLNRQTCGWCDYAGLCRAQMFGGALGTYDLAEYGLAAPEGATVLSEGRLARGVPSEEDAEGIGEEAL